MENAESQVGAAQKKIKKSWKEELRDEVRHRKRNNQPGKEITRMQEGGRDETKQERGIAAHRYFRPFKETDRKMVKMFVGLHF